MTIYHIESTAEADTHARAIDAWWREQRAGAPGLFVDELTRVLALLSGMPMLGASYRGGAAPEGMRRLVMRRVKCHLYYTVDVEKREILVHADLALVARPRSVLIQPRGHSGGAARRWGPAVSGCGRRESAVAGAGGQRLRRVALDWTLRRRRRVASLRRRSIRSMSCCWLCLAPMPVRWT